MLISDRNQTTMEWTSSHRRRQAVVAIIMTVTLFSLSGCASLIRPNYTQTLAELRSGDYTLDPEHAYIHFRVEHLGLSTVIGRFNRAEATLDFDPLEAASMQLDGVVDTASLDMNNQSLEAQLAGSDWLASERYPQAVFKTVSVEPLQDNEFRITGDFTLRGTTRPLILKATFKGGADNLLTGKYTLGFKASGSFKRSDYGMDALAALVADEVFLELNGEFQRVAP